ncbi:amidohydrolase family protein [Phytohabitans kaempferiae]|uniref:Amidohydrolase family protein n=1 Tax=Phytohabitans kaempferiae TaxID=1620943 RepID=A0ABV6MCM5_9ACTN
MTYIALEEAFAVPAADPARPPWAGNRHRTKTAYTEDWARQLVDFTEYRLPDMDAHGIDIQVLSLTVPGIQGETDAKKAVADAIRANDYLADQIAKHPDRFRGFAALPMQAPTAAIRELRRCIRDLGFCGALVNDHTNGRYLDEPVYEDFWGELESLDVPLYIHPNLVTADNWHVLDGHPELHGALWSFGVEVAGHALRLLFGGVFDRHPNATVILGHMGEMLPFQVSRLDSRYRVIDPVWSLKRLPSEYIGSNIVITTSGVFSPAVLEGAVLAIGADAIMFSVDYPYEATEEAVRGFEATNLSETDRAKIAHLNARRVLRL